MIGEVKRQLGSLQRQAAKARRHQTLSAELRLLDTHLGHEQFIQAGARPRRDRRRPRTRPRRLSHRRDANSPTAKPASRNFAPRWTTCRAIAGRPRRRAGMPRPSARRREQAGVQPRTRDGKRGLAGTLRDRTVRRARNVSPRRRSTSTPPTRRTREIAALLEPGQSACASRTRSCARRGPSASQAEEPCQRRPARRRRRRTPHRGSSARNWRASPSNSRRARCAANCSPPKSPGSNPPAPRPTHASPSSARHRRRPDDARRPPPGTARGEEAVAAAQKELAAADSSARHRHQGAGRRARRGWKSLRGLNEAGAGFSAGTQAVLRGLDRPELFKPAIIGVLGSSIDVETRFIPAVEAILGHHLQTVLLRDDEVAAELLETLATGKKVGRATLCRSRHPAAAGRPDDAPAARRRADLGARRRQVARHGRARCSTVCWRTASSPKRSPPPASCAAHTRT